MSEVTVSPEVAELGDKFVNLSVKQAQELANYLKDKYGIEPAGGGAVMMAPAAAAEDAGPAKAAEPTSFKINLKTKGSKPIEAIKVVKAATNLGLKEAKALVDGAPQIIKTGLSKEDAEKLVKELIEAGADAEVVPE